MKILIIGHFGGRNLGDELILLSQLQMLTKHFDNPTFVIYTYDELFTKSKYESYGYKIDTIKAFGLRKGFESTIDQIRKIKNIDFALLGGGGIMQDVYFAYGVFRYLMPAYLCIQRDIPVYSMSFGVSKFKYSANEKLLKNMLSYMNGISVRDTNSYDNLKKIVPNKTIYQLTDSALSFDKELVYSEITEDETLTIIVREFFEPYLKKICEMADKISCEYRLKKIIIVVFENNPSEEELASKICQELNNNDLDVQVFNTIDPIMYLSILKKSKVVISGRLHGIIPSVLLQKDVVCLTYAPKIKSFCEDNKLIFLEFKDLSISSFDLDKIINHCKNIHFNVNTENTENYLKLVKHTYREKPLLDRVVNIKNGFILFSIGISVILAHIINKLTKKEITSE